MRSGSVPGAFAILFIFTVGCGSDSITVVDPIPHSEVAGSYTLSVLNFDPQGTLPQADILARIPNANRPTLTVSAQGGAQIVYLDPSTTLTRTVDATVGTTASEVIVGFEAEAGYGRFLLSRNMSFSYSSATGSLTFEGPAPDGVSRDVLIGLVPEWENEQLLDPTPGSLRVVFTRSGS